MTECERLIENGLISSDFLEEETRCGFFVTKERKKLWAVLLSILTEIDSVCKKHNLTYFLSYGSLLGAIRHKGFIPWDDDIDLTMPRRDYDIFVTLSSEFKKPFFLQTPNTDKEYFFSFARVRNSNTTSFSELFKFQKMNHGVFIAIFPLDNCIPEEDYLIYEENKKMARMNSAFMRRNYPNLSDQDKNRVKEFGNNNPLAICKKIDRLASTRSKENTLYVANLASPIYPFKKQVFLKEDFKEMVYVPFEENYKFPIPNGWKRILETVYGDYRLFPPIEERGVWHSGTVINVDLPYELFFKQNDK